jgi:hypothetical protein
MTPSKEPRWPKIAKWKEVSNERKRKGRWVKDAMDIDEDGSGDVSKESEDHEKTSRRLRYVLLNQVFLFDYISSYRPVAICVSPSHAKVSRTLRKPTDPDTNILLSSLPMVSSISPQWASEVTSVSDNYM